MGHTGQPGIRPSQQRFGKCKSFGKGLTNLISFYVIYLVDEGKAVDVIYLDLKPSILSQGILLEKSAAHRQMHSLLGKNLSKTNCRGSVRQSDGSCTSITITPCVATGLGKTGREAAQQKKTWGCWLTPRQVNMSPKCAQEGCWHPGQYQKYCSQQD